MKSVYRLSLRLIHWGIGLCITGAGGAMASSPLPVVQAKATGCEGLTGLDIAASALSLPTGGGRVDAATSVSDTDAAGHARRYCKATGRIWPVDTGASAIRFQVNLPQEWNQRALQMGGGGTNGSVVTGLTGFSGAPAHLATPLARGYVTLGSDSGHDAAGKPPFDSSFALKQEELMNFAQWQIKKTLDVARYLTLRVYGQLPRYTYFVGGSQGGHEGFDAAQRYPDDYNGVVAHYPAYNIMTMWLGAQAQAQAIYGRALGVPSKAWMNPTKVAHLVAYVKTQCDGLDGIVDGVVSHVRACSAKITPATVRAALRCPDGADAGDTCLSDLQLAAMTAIASPTTFGFTLPSGQSGYPHWPLLEGATFAGVEHLGKTDTAQLDRYPFAPNGTAFQLFPAKSGIQGFITRDMSADPLAFDPLKWVDRIQQLAHWTEATSTDLGRFASRGGKLLLTHGAADDSISPHNTIAYWHRLVAALGASTVEGFARFYLVPGQGHGGGMFASRHNWLDTLEQWMEHDQAPAQLVASDGNTQPGTAATNGRTRPLCRYGTYPHYIGPAQPSQAQANDAAHFSCVPD